MAEVPYGPHLNNWIVNQLIARHEKASGFPHLIIFVHSNFSFEYFKSNYLKMFGVLTTQSSTGWEQGILVTIMIICQGPGCGSIGTLLLSGLTGGIMNQTTSMDR